LKYAHCVDIMQRLGISKIRPDGLSTQFVELCSINHILDSSHGIKVAFVTSKGITLLHTYHTDISSAYMSYLALHFYSKSRISASIIKTPTGQFSIVGAAILYEALEPMSNNENESKYITSKKTIETIPESNEWEVLQYLDAERLITSSISTRARSMMLLYGHRAKSSHVSQPRATQFTVSGVMDFNISTKIRSANLHRPDIDVVTLSHYFKAISANKQSTIIAEMGNFLAGCIGQPGESKEFLTWATTAASKPEKYELLHKMSELRSMFTWMNLNNLICHPKDDKRLIAELEQFIRIEEMRKRMPENKDEMKLIGNIKSALVPGNPRSVHDVFKTLLRSYTTMSELLSSDNPLSSIFYDVLDIQAARVTHSGQLLLMLNQSFDTRESLSHHSHERRRSFDEEEFSDDD
jgi:hypothetical protein